jgi:hypothetical protein
MTFIALLALLAAGGLFQTVPKVVKDARARHKIEIQRAPNDEECFGKTYDCLLKDEEKKRKKLFPSKSVDTKYKRVLR